MKNKTILNTLSAKKSGEKEFKYIQNLNKNSSCFSNKLNAFYSKLMIKQTIISLQYHYNANDARSR